MSKALIKIWPHLIKVASDNHPDTFIVVDEHIISIETVTHLCLSEAAFGIADLRIYILRDLKVSSK